MGRKGKNKPTQESSQPTAANQPPPRPSGPLSGVQQPSSGPPPLPDVQQAAASLGRGHASSPAWGPQAAPPVQKLPEAKPEAMAGCSQKKGDSQKVVEKPIAAGSTAPQVVQPPSGDAQPSGKTGTELQATGAQTEVAKVVTPETSGGGRKKKGKGQGGDEKAVAAGSSASSAPAPVVKPPSGDAQPSGKEPQAGAQTEAVKVVPPETSGGGRKKKGKGQGGGEKAVAAGSSAPSGSAPAAKPSQSGGAAISKMTVFDVPKRKEQKIVHKAEAIERKILIDVNYLPITFREPKMLIFHYDVTFNPDRPKGLFREALARLQQKHFPNRHPAFDGSKNLYVASKRLFESRNTMRDTVTIFDKENQRDKEFDITIQEASHDHQLSFEDLGRYMTTGRSTAIPQDVIQACDIALRAGLFSRFTHAGRSFFSKPAQPIDLGGGFDLWDGFYQSKIPAWRPYLNVDVANKAFPKERKVIDHIRTMRGFSEQELTHGLSQGIRSELQQFIKGLKVLYKCEGEAAQRTYRVNSLGVPPVKQEFEIGDTKKKTNVLVYFKEVKRITIRYPNLPLLHVGPPQKNTMVPMEFCTIISNQVVMRKLDEFQTSAMVKAAATATDIRRSRIMNNLKMAQYRNDPTLAEFGISVADSFKQVESIVLRAPQILYRNNALVNVTNGVWEMDRNNFISTPPEGMAHWAVLSKDRSTGRELINAMVKLFKDTGRSMGLMVGEPIILEDTFKLREDDIIENLKKLKGQNNNLQIVVVVMGRAHDAYSLIKRASELKTGVLTQCLKGFTVQRKMNRMTAVNILLKMNAKINGVNHTVAGPLKSRVFREPVMFVGGDVTHPSPGSDGVVSIAAVAASFDPCGFRYKMRYSLQPPRMEIIRDFEEIMLAHLNHFKLRTKRLPVRILYYRDGVSDGQFTQVLSSELTALKIACAKVEAGYSPKITILVVQKRHHTRFFPKPQDGDRSKNNNVLAGTVVDTEITHPTELDFYLVSHRSIQGTARPTKYHVLYDDNEFLGEELELLTYQLCYMFTRCNRAVSYPAPTYYAHLGAERARSYWLGQRTEGDLRQIQLTKGTIHENITDMFFV